jgi:hypothetical protein
VGEAPLQAAGLLVTLAILAGASPIRILRGARASWWRRPRGILAGFSRQRRPTGGPGAGLYTLIGGSALLGLLFLALALAIAPG